LGESAMRHAACGMRRATCGMGRAINLLRCRWLSGNTPSRARYCSLSFVAYRHQVSE
jgi:hypothetical protein